MSGFRIHHASLALLLASGAALALEESNGALKACRAEADDARRLACYDREMDRAQTIISPAVPPEVAREASPDVPAEASPDLPPPVLTAEEQFGREGAMAREQADRKKQESRALGELQAKVTEIWTRSDGLMVVSLDNGQEWKQNSPDSFFRLKTGDTVKIQPAAMNSFLMSGPSKRSTRVTRVK